MVAAGMIVTGLCSRYWQLLLAQGMMVGLGSGLLFLPSIAVLPQYFEKRRALATGIDSSGSAIGARTDNDVLLHDLADRPARGYLFSDTFRPIATFDWIPTCHLVGCPCYVGDPYNPHWRPQNALSITAHTANLRRQSMD